SFPRNLSALRNGRRWLRWGLGSESGLEGIRFRGQTATVFTGLSEDRAPHDDVRIRRRQELDGSGPHHLAIVLVQLNLDGGVPDDLGRARWCERAGDAHGGGFRRGDLRRQERARLRLRVNVKALLDVGGNG